MTRSDVIEAEAFAKRQRETLAQAGTSCLRQPNDRSEAQARAERDSKRKILDQAFAECVAKMPPLPYPQPLPDLQTKQYLAAPCGTPKERGGRYYNPTCVCGYLMKQHRVMDFSGPCVDPRGGAAGNMT